MAIADSLVAYWKLDEASGSRTDSFGANTLTDNNTVTQAVGKISNAAQFTAANLESLSIVDNAALSMGDIDFTITAWVYLDTKQAFNTAVGKWNNVTGPAREYLLFYRNSTDRFEFIVSNDGTAQIIATANTLGSPSLGTWYFVACWHDSVANTINIQVNNGAVDSTAHTTGVLNGNSPFRLGAVESGLYHDGRVDEVGIFKRVVGAGDLAAIYNGGAGLPYPFQPWVGNPHVYRTPLAVQRATR